MARTSSVCPPVEAQPSRPSNSTTSTWSVREAAGSWLAGIHPKAEGCFSSCKLSPHQRPDKRTTRTPKQYYLMRPPGRCRALRLLGWWGYRHCQRRRWVRTRRLCSTGAYQVVVDTWYCGFVNRHFYPVRFISTNSSTPVIIFSPFVYAELELVRREIHPSESKCGAFITYCKGSWSYWFTILCSRG
jgi:hypothetical protein